MQRLASGMFKMTATRIRWNGHVVTNRAAGSETGGTGKGQCVENRAETEPKTSADPKCGDGGRAETPPLYAYAPCREEKPQPSSRCAQRPAPVAREPKCCTKMDKRAPGCDNPAEIKDNRDGSKDD